MTDPRCWYICQCMCIYIYIYTNVYIYIYIIWVNYNISLTWFFTVGILGWFPESFHHDFQGSGEQWGRDEMYPDGAGIYANIGGILMGSMLYGFLWLDDHTLYQWEFQDPKMELRKRTIFWAIFSGDIPWNSGPKNRPYICIGTSNLGSWNGHWMVVACLLVNHLWDFPLWMMRINEHLQYNLQYT